MAISEAQLGTWANRGPTAQFTATYDTLRSCLEDSHSPYYARSFSIFLQGSYKNETNIYADSDVDVVIRLDDVYYTDLSSLSADDTAAFNAARSSSDYTVQQFKAAVVSWLVQKYGEDVKPGKKAVLVKGRGARRDADVLICAKVRRYLRFKSWNDQNYIEGIRFLLADGTPIDNFPIQHHDHCTTKHQMTNQWFKPTVRVYKNLRNTMIEKGYIADGLAPSYFLEGLLYNVERTRFGGTNQQNFYDTLNWLVQADRSKFVCANEVYLLLHPTSLVTWRAEKCTEFLTAAVKYYNGA